MVMVRRSRVARAGVAGAVTGLLVAGVSVVPGGGAYAAADPGRSIAPMPVTAVPLAQAGEVVQWKSNQALLGRDGVDMADLPASLSGVAVTQVALSSSVGFAVTAAGRLVSWGADGDRLQQIPAAVAATEVAQVATQPGGYAGVVTRAGEVKVWGVQRRFETPVDVPAGLTGVKQLALTGDRALALRQDGTVVAWGRPGFLPGEPPPGLRATAIAAAGNTAFALTTEGTVVGWGSNGNGQLNLPDAVKEPGNVTAIAATGNGALATLADGSLVSWGRTGTPAGVAALDPVAIVGGDDFLATVDGDGVIHHWYAPASGGSESGLVPAELNGRALSYLALGFYGAGAAIVTKMLRGADPRIGGSAVVGQTLTATPGTFSASPEAVTGQWLADGAPIAGASGATLALTPALLGRSISYRSTATKAGQTTVSSTSAAVTVTNPSAPPVPPVPKVGSTTTVLKVQVAKKAAQATVTGKVTATKPVTGTAKVVIKKGKKAILAKSVKVPATGAVKLTVKKFGKLVIKKLTPKGKKGKKPSYRGAYVVTLSYTGNDQVKPSSGSKKFTVKR